MNQKTRSLVSLGVLLAATAAAGLYAYFGVHQKQEQEKQAKEKRERIFDAERKDVSNLTVEAKGQSTTVARTADGAWEIVSPVHAPADAPTVDALLDKLLGLKSKMVVESNAADLAKFGLDKPALTVTAKLSGGKELRLRSGAESGFDNSAYVATGDAKDVLQAEGGYKWALEKDTFDLRDKRIVTFEDNAVQELDVRVGQTHYAAKRADKGWELTAPMAERADEATVTKVLSTLRNLRALRYVSETASPEDQKRWGVASPGLEATLTLHDGRKVVLAAAKVNDNGEKTFAQVKDAVTIAEVANSVFDEVNVKTDDLRDKTLVRFEPNQVRSMTLHFGDEAVTAKREAGADAGELGAWSFAGPSSAKPKQWKLGAILTALAGYKGVAIAHENPTDLSKFGLDKPTRRIELFDADGKPIATVWLGSEHAERVYARSTTDRKVFEIEKGKLHEWPQARAELEEPVPSTPADAGTK